MYHPDHALAEYAALDQARAQAVAQQSHYDSPEPKQWMVRHEGADLLITLWNDGSLEVAPRTSSLSSWGAPLVVTEVAS